jgi:hypothetical protein
MIPTVSVNRASRNPNGPMPALLSRKEDRTTMRDYYLHGPNEERR